MRLPLSISAVTSEGHDSSRTLHKAACTALCAARGQGGGREVWKGSVTYVTGVYLCVCVRESEILCTCKHVYMLSHIYINICLSHDFSRRTYLNTYLFPLPPALTKHTHIYIYIYIYIHIYICIVYVCESIGKLEQEGFRNEGVYGVATMCRSLIF